MTAKRRPGTTPSKPTLSQPSMRKEQKAGPSIGFLSSAEGIVNIKVTEFQILFEILPCSVMLANLEP